MQTMDALAQEVSEGTNISNLARDYSCKTWLHFAIVLRLLEAKLKSFLINGSGRDFKTAQYWLCHMVISDDYTMKKRKQDKKNVQFEEKKNTMKF